MVDTLVDAGPLVAMLNRRDDRHAETAQLVRSLNCALRTTLPAISEAMYLLGRWGGAAIQQNLYRAILRGDLVIEDVGLADLARMSDLMTQYADLPMDFADASLVVVAERLGLTRVLTLDHRDFSVYRLNGKTPFVVLSP